VAGEHERRPDRGTPEHVIEEPGGGAVMRADPGVTREVLDLDLACACERVIGRQEHPERVGEERDELDVVGRRVRLLRVPPRRLGLQPERGAPSHRA
jgi:hypothetical protein